MANLVYDKNIERKYHNGMNYLIYTPENVSPDTGVFVYVHGGGSMSNEDRYNDWNPIIQKQIQVHGSDSIVIMPTMNERWHPEWASKTMDIVEIVQNEHGITNDNVTCCGFSWGGWGAAKTTIENIQRNPDVEPQVLFMLDDYYKENSYVEKYVLGDGGAEALASNDTIIFSYVSRAGAYMNEGKRKDFNAYINAGANVVKVVCKDGGHAAIRDNFFKNGLINYTAGTINLPSEGYTYEAARVTIDPATGSKVINWEPVDVSQINTTSGLYNFFGIDAGRLSGNNAVSMLGGAGISSGTTLVTFGALYDWSSKMNAINEDSIGVLGSMLSTIKGLEDCWMGNLAKGFIDDSSSFVETIQKCHNDMKSVAEFLKEVANTTSQL